MARALWLVFFPLVAFAQTPGVSTTRAEPSRVLATALTTFPADGGCAVQPVSWSDPSEGWTFAVHPTARLDDQELAATQLRGLVELRMMGRGLHLLILGSDATMRLSFSHAGWRARWPFC